MVILSEAVTDFIFIQGPPGLNGTEGPMGPIGDQGDRGFNVCFV